MKSRCISLVRSLLVITLAFELMGCINSTTTVTVASDGSGTIEERSIMTAAAVNMMKQFAQGLGQALGGDDNSPASGNPMLQENADYTKRAARLGDGVKFVSAEEITDESGGKGALVRYAFEDIRKVQLTQKDAMSAMDTMKSRMPGPGQIPGLPGQPEEEKDDPITFEFESGNVASLKVNVPRPDEEKSGKSGETPGTASTRPQPGPAELAQAKQILGNMGFALVVKVDGEIVESNATYQDGNATTLFSMDFGKMLDSPESFLKLQALGDEKDFDKIKESLTDIPGMKFETSETVEVRFK